MLKIFATMSLAALLSLSSTFSAFAEDAPAPVCRTVQELLTAIPAPPLADLKGDEATAFMADINAYLKSKGATVMPPADTDEVLLFPQSAAVILFIPIVKGCTHGMGSVNTAAVQHTKSPVDDGKI